MSLSSFQNDFNHGIDSLLSGIDDILTDLYLVRLALRPNPNPDPLFQFDPMEFDFSSDEESIIAPSESSFPSSFYLDTRSSTSDFSSRESSRIPLPDNISDNSIIFHSLSAMRNSSETSSSEGSSRIFFYIQSQSSFFDSLATLVDTDIGSDSVETLVDEDNDYYF